MGHKVVGAKDRRSRELASLQKVSKPKRRYSDNLGARINVLGPDLSPTFDTIQQSLLRHKAQHSSCPKTSSCQKQWCLEKLREFVDTIQKTRDRSTKPRGASYETRPSSWCLDVFGPPLPRSAHETEASCKSLNSAESKLQKGGCQCPESALLHAVVLMYEEKLNDWLHKREDIRRFTDGRLWIKTTKAHGEKWVEASRCKQASDQWFPQRERRKFRERQPCRKNTIVSEKPQVGQVKEDKQEFEFGSFESKGSLHVPLRCSWTPVEISQTESHLQNTSSSPSPSPSSSIPHTDSALLSEGDTSSHDLDRGTTAFQFIDDEGNDVENEDKFLKSVYGLHLEEDMPAKLDGPHTSLELPEFPSFDSYSSSLPTPLRSRMNSLTSSSGADWGSFSEGLDASVGLAWQEGRGQERLNLQNRNLEPSFGVWMPDQSRSQAVSSAEKENKEFSGSPTDNFRHAMRFMRSGHSDDRRNTRMIPTDSPRSDPIKGSALRKLRASVSKSPDMSKYPEMRPQADPSKALNLQEDNRRQKRRHADPLHGDRDLPEQRGSVKPEKRPLKEIIEEIPSIFRQFSGGKSLDDLRSEYGKQERTDWVKRQVEDLAKQYPGLNVIAYKTGKFIEGPYGSVLTVKQIYKPEGSEECVKIAMDRCENVMAAYKHVAPLVNFVTYHLAVFESGIFQNLADEGCINWNFEGKYIRVGESPIVEFLK